MRTLPFLTLLAVATVACDQESATDPSLRADGYANAADAAARTYDITIENLTSSQPLSPGVVVAHSKQVSLFARGTTASEGIRLIAEQGNPATALADLTGAAGVFQVTGTMAPVHRIGGPGPSTLTTQIAAAANADRLSLAVMLICTNDGFAGLDAVKLPGGLEPATFYAMAYDAGTEVNDETSTSIVDPCFAIGPVSADGDGDSRTAEGGVVGMHAGIGGGADLDPSLHGWSGPIARVTVRRVK
ncbi:MAG: spondin domain-containing protein [Gemmatimonadota bacterium]|nr:spondin domain-containing protein [Gemmatimonadota bacterium]